MRLVRYPMSTARSIALLLQVILVPVGVKSVCVEDDCTDQAITVVDRSSGVCVTCYPCPQCTEGHTPSVPCGTTVLQGTDIHCVPTAPGPLSVLVSSTNVIFTLPADPTSVSSWHASTTATRQMTATAVTSYIHDHPSVSTTSSKDHAGSRSSITVDYTVLNDSKMGNRTVVYLFCGTSLALIFLGILYRLRKSKTTRSQNPSSNQTMQRAPCSSMTGAAHAENGVPCTVCVHPETNTASFSRSYPNNDQQETTEGMENQLFHHDQTLPEDNDIPSSLDDNHAQGNQQKEICEDTTGSDVGRSLIDFTSDFSSEQPSGTTIDPKTTRNVPSIFAPKVDIHLISTPGSAPQQLSTFDSWNGSASAMDQQGLVKWADLLQAEKYRCKMNETPFQLHLHICLTLDIIRGDGKDVREFASKLDITVKQFECLQQAAKIKSTTTTSVILAKKSSWTVGDFIAVMKDMERDDIINLINEWK